VVIGILIALQINTRNQINKKKEFNTMIDVLTFMHSLGYEDVDTHAVTLGGQKVYHYLLRKVKLIE
jgi:hypothetical protein